MMRPRTAQRPPKPAPQVLHPPRPLPGGSYRFAPDSQILT